MAKKRQQKERRARKHAQQQRHRPAQRVQEAVVAFKSGDVDKALALATSALTAANDAATCAAAQNIVIEARFRAAATTTDLRTRLDHLDSALQLAPDETRLHYHRAITLWGLGRMAEALPDLAALQTQAGHRSAAAFLYQLACAVTDQSWSEQSLSGAEVNTVRMLQGLMQGTDTSTLLGQIEHATLLGDQPELWQTLLYMKDKPKSAPVARLQAIADGITPPGARAIVQYYLGVGALRKGDVETALSAWRIAAEAGMTAARFTENHQQMLRVQAHALGQEGHWHEVITLLQTQPATETPDVVLQELLAVAHMHLGYAAAQASDWNTAARHWQEAVTRSASRQLLQNLALAREALGQWRPAADAWREMLRRRPRKQDHPDALTDPQMAILWHHVAECYERVEETGEVLTCLKNAVKYAPTDVELRVKLADVSQQMGREEAAEKELERVLAIDAQHIPALLRLGALYADCRDRDPLPLWRRVLAMEPQHAEAREALAQFYIAKVQEEDPQYGWFDRLRRRSTKEKIALLQEGLRELPGHPALLMEMGDLYATMKKVKEARAYFIQAWEAAPQKPSVVAAAIHSLLHAGGGDIVTRLLPTVRQIPGLLAMFWVDLMRQVLQCKLGQAWVDVFGEEALSLADQGQHGETRAYVLVQLFEAANNAKAPEVAARYAARIRAEHPHSGGVEFTEAYQAHHRHDSSRALRLLQQAQCVARQAHETGIATLAEQVAGLLQTPARSLFDLLVPPGGRGKRRGRNLFDELLEELEEEDIDEFQRFF
jgi:tetratricopeptide (TPR) repeat protein